MYIYIHISRTRLVELVPRALHHRRLRPHAAAVQSIDRWIKAGGKKMMMMVPPLSFHISTNPTDICIDTNTKKNNPTWCHHFPFIYQPVTKTTKSDTHRGLMSRASSSPTASATRYEGIDTGCSHTKVRCPDPSTCSLASCLLCLGIGGAVEWGEREGRRVRMCTCLLPVRFTNPHTSPPPQTSFYQIHLPQRAHEGGGPRGGADLGGVGHFHGGGVLAGEDGPVV